MTGRMDSATLDQGEPGGRVEHDEREERGGHGSPAFRFSQMESLLRGHTLRHLTVDGIEAVFVRDPVLVRDILVGESRNYGKGELFRKARNLSRVGMLSEDESMHRHYRRLANPYVRSARIDEYVPAMRDIVSDTISSWRAGEPVDVQAEMCRITCAIVTGTLIVGLPQATIKALSERLSRLAWEMIRKPLYGKAAARAARPGASARLSRARREFRELLSECIAGLLDSPTSTAGYLSALLADSDSEGNRVLTPEQVCEEAVMMLTAATVTTASVMSWALHVLSTDDSAEEQLLKDLVHRRTAGAGLEHGASGYTLRFLAEILRLYPPVWISCRKALVDVRLGSHRLPAGTNLVFSSYLLHRDPGRYPDPHRFDPDRWLSLRPSSSDASYIPFGVGSKGCIGEPFAWEQLEVILDVVTQKWKLRPDPGHRVRTAPETTLHPRRLLMTPEPR